MWWCLGLSCTCNGSGSWLGIAHYLCSATTRYHMICNVVSCMFTFTISKHSLVFTLWFAFTILHRSWRTAVTVNANWGVKNKGGLGWECVKPISNLLNLVFYIKKALVGTNSLKTCQCFSYIIHLTFMPTIVSCIVHAIALQCQHMHNTCFSLHVHFYYCYYYIP